MIAVDFSEELFVNIGAFTLEHLNRVLSEIKRESTTLILKGGLSYLKETDLGEVVTNLPFFNDYLSCCLIHANSMAQLRILGKNTFDNVWLIDRKAPMQTAINSERMTDSGLILYLRYFKGNVQIGGPKEGS